MTFIYILLIPSTWCTKRASFPLLSIFLADLLDAYLSLSLSSSLLLSISACLILLPLKLFAAIFLWTLFKSVSRFLKSDLVVTVSLLVVYYFYYLTLHQLLYYYIRAYKRFSDRFFQLFQGLLELFKFFSFSKLSSNARLYCLTILLPLSSYCSTLKILSLWASSPPLFSIFLLFSTPLPIYSYIYCSGFNNPLTEYLYQFPLSQPNLHFPSQLMQCKSTPLSPTFLPL